MQKGKARNSVILILLFTIFSCSEKPFYSNQIKTRGIWEKDNRLNFQFEIQDTTARYHLFIDFINNNKYPHSNIHLFTKFVDQKNIEIQDTLEYPIALPSGDWIANDKGKGYQRKLVFRNDFKFQGKGKYQIEIQQAMRYDSLLGIESIGLEIHKFSTQ